MRKTRRSALTAVFATAVIVAGAASLLGVGTAQAAPLNTTGAAATSGGLKVAYFDQWSIYQNGYYPKNIDTSGAAGKLDYLIYDFENIDPVNLTCFEATKASDQDPAGESDPNAGDGAGDSFADYQKSYGSTISVNGQADVYSQPIVGNFNQLKELKAKHPNLKILLSLGGWTYSKYFSDAAATPASRQKLVSSCVDMFIRGDLPSQGGYGGPATGKGIFDGFDIDWEYPGSAAGHLGNRQSPADKKNYTALLAEFRGELNTQGATDGKTYALSAALPSGQEKIAAGIETNNIGQYLTFGDPMTYDMHGAWDATGPTNHQSALYSDPNDPMTPVSPGAAKYNIAESVKAYTAGDPQYGIPGGFPASRLTLGIPFYYRGWTGVPAGTAHGLFQTATGPASGAADSGNVPGIQMYKELGAIVNNAADTYWDPVAQAAYFYDGTNFWSGEDARSIQAKADYLHCNGLGGAMMFSLYDLDPASTLFNAAVADIDGSAASCPTGPPPTTGPPSTTPPTSTPTSTPSTPPTPTPTTLPGQCTSTPWSSTAAYSGGAVVSYGGHNWTAKWWTQGDIPGANAQNVWTDGGSCGPATTPPPGSCTTPVWNSIVAYGGGSVVEYGTHKYTAKWWTQGDVPGSASQTVWTDNGVCSS